MAIVSRIITAAVLVSLAFVSHVPTGVNALSVHQVEAGRSHHELIAKAKRADASANKKRCRPRTSSLASSTAGAVTSTLINPPASTSAPAATTSAPVTTKAATTKSAAPATTSSVTTPPPSNGPGKVGLCWSNGEDDNLADYVTKKVKYIYTWSPSCPPQAAGLGLQCARMLWGYKQLDAFRKARESSNTAFLMGPNEVNEPTQSYMTPAQGIKLWNEEIRPYKKNGIRLISPSVTSAPSGKKWFTEFFAGCGGNDKCGVDVLSVHWYDVTVEGFKKYMNDFHDSFGVNLWVSEFACQNFNGGPQCSAEFIPQFMSEVTNWMNSVDWIEGFFAFGLLHDMWNVNYANQLMAGNGKPTKLGYQFINS